MAWFGVRTLYRTRNVSSSSGACSVEQRVVLVEAADFEAAIDLAEARAAAYVVKEGWRNAAGEVIEQSYLGAADSFRINGSPANGSEVYSAVSLHEGSQEAQDLLARYLGPEAGPRVGEALEQLVPDLELTAQARERSEP